MKHFLIKLILPAAAACCLFSGSTLADPLTIQPGALWSDDREKHIQAHGGGILKHDNVYYWFGEDYSKGNDPEKRFVACYSSPDLVHWTFRNQVVGLSDPEHLGPKWVLQRPKVFYNQKTGKYVMYAHIDGPFEGRGGYSFASVAVFTCDTVDGNYQYVRSFRPFSQESRDIGQFIDDDGSAYLIFESRPTKGFYIAQLSDDYMDVEKVTCFILAPLEGGALVHYNGLYYLIGSRMSGWNPNPNLYATASRLEGPWSEFKDIAPPASKTYGSQSTMLTKITGTKQTSVIFMADIWKAKTQWDSRYLWMPLEIGDGKLWLPEPAPWKVDVKTGEAVRTD